MSDVPEAPGWWQASDGKWYPPEQFTGSTAPTPQGPPVGYGPTPGFPQPTQVGYGYGAVPPKNETLAVVALVLGIAAIPMLCLCGSGVVAGIAAVVCGILGRKKIKESPGTLTGDGMALAGLITGAVAVALGVAYFFAVIVLNVAGSTG